MTIHNHDIIKVLTEIYIEYQGGRWCDHFIKKAVFLRVKTEPTNNGNFIAYDKKGHLYHYNTNNENILEIIRG